MENKTKKDGRYCPNCGKMLKFDVDKINPKPGEVFTMKLYCDCGYEKDTKAFV